MDVIVKICGLSTGDTLEAALDAKADMIGLVFYPPSPRSVSLPQAARLAAQARGHAEIVALTVDMNIADTAEIVEMVNPDWLQLHGQESPEAVADTKKRFGRRVMKALGVRTAKDLASAATFSPVADRILLDAKPPNRAALPGGRGAAFDWTLLEGFTSDLPFMLAGGIHEGNVENALRITRANGVDVSSGIETAPGKKDPELIYRFVAAARKAASGLGSAASVESVAT